MTDVKDIEIEEFETKDCRHRYRIIEKSTGCIIDDAQGYGYKSKQNALICIRYKSKPHVKPTINYEKIDKWILEHKDFIDEIEKDRSFYKENKYKFRLTKDYVYAVLQRLNLKCPYDLHNVAIRLGGV